MSRADRIILAIAQVLFSIAAVVAVLIIFAACASSQLLRVHCPETARTYCPAQHFDSVRVKDAKPRRTPHPLHDGEVTAPDPRGGR